MQHERCCSKRRFLKQRLCAVSCLTARCQHSQRLSHTAMSLHYQPEFVAVCIARLARLSLTHSHWIRDHLTEFCRQGGVAWRLLTHTRTFRLHKHLPRSFRTNKDKRTEEFLRGNDGAADKRSALISAKAGEIHLVAGLD